MLIVSFLHFHFDSIVKSGVTYSQWYVFLNRYLTFLSNPQLWTHTVLHLLAERMYTISFKCPNQEPVLSGFRKSTELFQYFFPSQSTPTFIVLYNIMAWRTFPIFHRIDYTNRISEHLKIPIFNPILFTNSTSIHDQIWLPLWRTLRLP